MCSSEYGVVLGGKRVGARCEKWGGHHTEYCYLTGGPAGRGCEGAKLARSGEFYYTYARSICDGEFCNGHSLVTMVFPSSISIE